MRDIGNNNAQLADSCTPEFGLLPVKQEQTGYKNSIGVGALALITFATVAGGPYGTEEGVGAVGPCIMLAMLFTAPFLWSMPIALMSTELATTIPATGGSINWVIAAFGPFWGYMNGWVQLCSNFVDNAVYCVISVSYLQASIGELEPWMRTAISLSFVLLCVALNVWGLQVVGKAALVFAILVFTPFIVLLVIGYDYYDTDYWFTGPPGNLWDGRFGTGLAVVLWQMSGWDAVVSCVEEVRNPSKTIPKAFSIAMVLMMLNYIVPILIGVCVMTNAEDWHTGAYAMIGHMAGGKWLGVWITATGVFACLGQLNVNIATTSREAYCMCSIGILPPQFQKLHPTRKTPWICILFMGTVIFSLSFLDFSKLVEMDSILTACTVVIEFASFLKFRHAHPNLVRPYKVPVGTVGAWIMSAIPTGLAILLMTMADYESVFLALVCAMLGVCFFVIGMRWDTSGRFLFCALCRGIKDDFGYPGHLPDGLASPVSINGEVGETKPLIDPEAQTMAYGGVSGSINGPAIGTADAAILYSVSVPSSESLLPPVDDAVHTPSNLAPKGDPP